jgi:putative transposase
MEVSRTAYYRYLRGASYQPARAKQEQLRAVEEIFWLRKRRYGLRRILADLQDLGYSVGRQRVRSLMQQQGGHPANPKIINV